MSEQDWREEDSQMFIDYGRYFIPDRKKLIQPISDLIPFTPYKRKMCAESVKSCYCKH